MVDITVYNASDSGPGSFRDALIAASNIPYRPLGHDTIRFSPALAGQTINLQSPLEITGGYMIVDGDIDGDGIADITISGDANGNGVNDVGDVRILNVTSNNGITPHVHLDNIILEGGRDQKFIIDNDQPTVSNIFNTGDLFLTNVIIRDGVAISIIPDGAPSASTVFNDTGTIYTGGVVFENNFSRASYYYDSEEYNGFGGDASAGIINEGSILFYSETISFSGFAQGGDNYRHGGDATIGILNRGYTIGAPAVAISSASPAPVPGSGATPGEALPVFANQREGTSYPFTEAEITILGTEGADQIVAYGGAGISIFASGGDDTVTTIGADDIVRGGDGDDIFILANGNVDAFGEDGNDTFRLAENEGAHELIGGAGADTADFSLLDQQIDVDLEVDGVQTATPSLMVDLVEVENVFGGSLDDQLTGDNGDNVLAGGGGSDTLFGGGGSDTLIASNGGTSDNPTELRGGIYSDEFSFSAGVAVIDGGQGYRDAFVASTALSAGVNISLARPDMQTIAAGTTIQISNVEDLVGGSGADTLTGDSEENRISGGAGADRLLGGSGDTLLGGAGSDHIIIGDDGLPDEIDGGAGSDILDLSGSNDGFSVDFAEQSFQRAGGGSVERISGIEMIIGSTASDQLIGGAGSDEILGEGGDDLLFGGSGGDLLVGGIGNDVFSGGANDDNQFGGAGDDRFVHDAGDNFIDGGANFDRATFRADLNQFEFKKVADRLEVNGDGGTSTFVNVEQFEFSGATHDLATIQSVSGSDFADRMDDRIGLDRLFGFNGNDRINGRNGEDEIRGGLGRDTILGGAEADKLFGDGGSDLLKGGGGQDRLKGGGGKDRLIGGGGDDKIFGGGGKDTIKGNRGDDLLVGNGGGDVFIFGRNHGDDKVRGFKNGTDKLDVSALADSLGDMTITRSGNGVLIRFNADAGQTPDAFQKLSNDFSAASKDGTTIFIAKLRIGQVDDSDFIF